MVEAGRQEFILSHTELDEVWAELIARSIATKQSNFIHDFEYWFQIACLPVGRL